MKIKDKSTENYKLKGVYNFIANAINYITNLGVSFFVSPIIIRGLGDSIYGVWKVLNQLTGYLNTFEFQTTDTLKWVVANKRAVYDQEKLKKEVSAALVVATLVIPFFLVGGIVMVYYAPTIANVSDNLVEIVRVTMTILVTGFILKKYTSIPLSVLKGMNLGYKKVGIQAFLQILSGILNVLVIFFTDYGIVGLALANIIIAILGGVLFLHYVKLYVPWFGLSKPTKTNVIGFFKTSAWLFLWTISSLVLVSTDLVLLGYLAAPSLVTVYVVTRFLPQLIQGAITIIRGALLPGFGNLIGKNEIEKVSNARNLLMNVTWIFSISLGASILMVNESFVSLWVGEERYGGDLVTLLILLITIQYMFIKNDSMIIVTSLSIKENFLFTLLAAFGSVGLKFVLIPELGIIGLCVSLLVGRLLLTILMPIIINKITGIKTSVKLIIKPMLITVVTLSFAYNLSEFVLLNNYITIGLTFIAITAILTCIIFWIGTNQTQKKELISVTQELYNKIK